MTGLRTKLPKDFAPVRVKLHENKGPILQFWVYKDGKAINYLQATSKETLDWVEELFPGLKAPTEGFGLAQNRALLLDTVIHNSIFRHSSLLGGEEYWNKLPEWQQIKNLIEKGKEDE